MAKNIIAWKTKQRSYQFVVFAPAQTVAQLCVFRRWKRVLFSIGLTRRIIYNCRYTSLLVMLYLSSIVKYGFVRDIPGRSENAVPMARRHAIHRVKEVGTVKKWNLYFCTDLFLDMWKCGSHGSEYSIVKDSSADLGVNFKIVQNRPTVKPVRTKISKKIFFAYSSIFLYFWEKIKRYHFSYFEYLS